MRKSAHSAKYKKLIAALREMRQSKGITQTELAKRLRRPQSFVAKYEQGERRLDVIEFVTIAEMIGVDPIALIRSALDT